MKTIRQFLSQRPNCPFCQQPISTFLESGIYSEKIKLENDRLLIGSGSYINIDNHSFHIQKKGYRETSFNLINKCGSCRRYLTSSNSCYLNCENKFLYFDNQNEPAGFYFSNEWFSFLIPSIQENGRSEIIILDNWFGLDENCESDITFWNARNPCLYDDNQLDTNAPRNYHSLKLPHIPFTTPEQTVSRIKTLINFA